MELGLSSRQLQFCACLAQTFPWQYEAVSPTMRDSGRDSAIATYLKEGSSDRIEQEFTQHLIIRVCNARLYEQFFTQGGYPLPITVVHTIKIGL